MDVVSLGAFLIALAIALALAFPLAKPLKAHAGVFYALACALVGAYCGALAAGVNMNSWHIVTFVLQKGYLSSILLAVVMFTGCLDDTSALKRRLRPVRGELSVLSFIFILGHVVVFAPSYLARLFGGAALKVNVTASIVVAVVLTAIFVVLGATSFKFVRRRMNPRAWKAIQRFAYAMAALYVVHIGFFLSTSAFGGSGKGFASFMAYCVVVGLYAAVRIAKAMRDARAKKAPASM